MIYKWMFAIGIFFACLGVSQAFDLRISQLPLGSAAQTTVNDSFPYLNSSNGLTQRLLLSDIVNLPFIIGAYAPIANPVFTGSIGLNRTPISGDYFSILANQSSSSSARFSNLTPAGAFVFQLEADTASGGLGVYSSTYASGTTLQDHFALFSNSDASGLILASTSGSGDIGFYTGGALNSANEALIIDSSQNLNLHKLSASLPLQTDASKNMVSAAINLSGSQVTGILKPSSMPTPTATSLGGVESAALVSHQFLNSIATNGSIGQSQPAFTDISGSVAASQLPTPTATTLGGVESAALVSHQFLNSIATNGSIGQSQPAFTDISGVAAPTQLPSPTATSLGGVESAAIVSHQFLNSIATNGSIGQSQPAFTDISGVAAPTQLPSPTATTLGGIESYGAVSNQWINTISTSGVPSSTQPAFSNISGSVAASQLPNPTATTLGGVESLGVVSHQWINTISTSGVPAATQPAFTDISGSVAATQLPNPTSSTLGGVESLAVTTHQWINTISTSGVPASTQPAFSDISGSVAASQMPALTGDITTSAGAVATTLAASISSAHTFSGAITMSAAGTGLAVSNNETVGTTLAINAATDARRGLIVNGPTTADTNAVYAQTIDFSPTAVATGTPTLNWAGLEVGNVASNWKLAANVNNAGGVFGIYDNVQRGAGSTDAGTLATLHALEVDFGHLSTGAAAVTTNSVGVYVQPYNTTGSTTNLYDIYLAAPTTGASPTPTLNYGIYQVSSAQANYFAGTVSMGTTSTTGAALNTSGTVYHASLGTVTAGTNGAACFSASNQLGANTANCIASLLSYKQDLELMDGQDALDTVKALANDAVYYRYRDTYLGQQKDEAHAKDRQPGFIADWVEKTDPRYSLYDAKGKLSGVRYEQLSATEAVAISKLSEEIAQLKTRIKELEKRK